MQEERRAIVYIFSEIYYGILVLIKLQKQEYSLSNEFRILLTRIL